MCCSGSFRQRQERNKKNAVEPKNAGEKLEPLRKLEGILEPRCVNPAIFETIMVNTSMDHLFAKGAPLPRAWIHAIAKKYEYWSTKVRCFVNMYLHELVNGNEIWTNEGMLMYYYMLYIRRNDVVCIDARSERWMMD